MNRTPALGAALLDRKAFRAEWIPRLEEQHLLLGDLFEIAVFQVESFFTRRFSVCFGPLRFHGKRTCEMLLCQLACVFTERLLPFQQGDHGSP